MTTELAIKSSFVSVKHNDEASLDYKIGRPVSFGDKLQDEKHFDSYFNGEDSGVIAFLKPIFTNKTRLIVREAIPHTMDKVGGYYLSEEEDSPLLSLDGKEPFLFDPYLISFYDEEECEGCGMTKHISEMSDVMEMNICKECEKC